MWIFNVIALVVIVSLAGFGIAIYGNDLVKAFGILFSGFKSLLFVILIILIRVAKALIFGAIGGGISGAIFKVAGAPINIIKTSAITVGAVIFAVLAIKVLLEEWNNLWWSVRNDVRNRYRQRY